MIFNSIKDTVKSINHTDYFYLYHQITESLLNINIYP